MLVAVGLPPVVANASNTIGMTPAGLSGSFGYRRELREHPRVTALVLLTCALGSVAGALLLLALPPGVFESIVPWLILGTSILVGIQPWISRRLKARRGDGAPDRVHMSPLTTFWATLTGVYGGYFGAGSGVMMMAVLGFGTDLDLRIVNALKTLAVMAANVVATRDLPVPRRARLGRDRPARGRIRGGRLRRRAHRPAAARTGAADPRRDRRRDGLDPDDEVTGFPALPRWSTMTPDGGASGRNP